MPTGRPSLYFIGGRPAGEVPPPGDGYENFTKTSDRVAEIVNILATTYRAAVIGTAKLPEPHQFFNKYNKLCCNFHHRHFPSHFKKAVNWARQRIEQDSESDEEYPPSPSSTNTKPSKQTPSSRRKTSSRDPESQPEKIPSKMNLAPLQTKQDADEYLPNPQVHYRIQQFHTGNNTEMAVISIPSNFGPNDIKLQRDTDNRSLLDIRLYGQSDLDDHETVQRAYTSGNMILLGGDLDGAPVCMTGNEGVVERHENYLRQNSPYDQGWRRNDNPSYSHQVVKFEDAIENGFKYQLTTLRNEQFLFVEVIHSSAPPDEIANFHARDLAIVSAARVHNYTYNVPPAASARTPPPYRPQGGGGRGGRGGRGGGDERGGRGGRGGRGRGGGFSVPAAGHYQTQAAPASYHHQYQPQGGPPTPAGFQPQFIPSTNIGGFNGNG